VLGPGFPDTPRDCDILDTLAKVMAGFRNGNARELLMVTASV
jgi:hypothetical protein